MSCATNGLEMALQEAPIMREAESNFPIKLLALFSQHRKGEKTVARIS